MKKYLPYIIYYALVSVCLIVTLGFCFNNEDNNGSGDDKLAPVSYEMITPNVPKLSSITAEYGSSLADIKSMLPAGFSFQAEPETLVGDVGSHTFLVSYKVPNDTTGRFKTVTDIQVTIVVSPKELTVPTVTSSGAIVYSGEKTDVKTLLNNYDTNLMEITENEFGTNAGDYQTKIKITSANYVFVGGGTETVVSWNIGKLKLTKPTMTDKVYRYTGTRQTLELLGFDAETMTITGNSGSDVVGYTAKINLKDESNYCWADGTISEISFNWQILKRQLKKVEVIIPDNAIMKSEAKPASNRVIWFTVPYTEEGITLRFVNGDQDGLKITGNILYSDGTTRASVSLDPYSEWEDGTTDAYAFRWGVEEAA